MMRASRRSAVQDELVEVDEFYDADNISSVVRESDFAPFAEVRRAAG